jgi:hypothetical protein
MLKPKLEADFAITIIWTMSFLLCISILVYFMPDIPDLFERALKAVFDTFATPLGGILGYVFSRKHLSRQTNNDTIKSLDILAITITVFYCGVFDILMLRFAFGRSNVAAVIEGYAQLRPYTAFIVTGVLAFYLGAEKRLASKTTLKRRASPGDNSKRPPVDDQ